MSAYDKQIGGSHYSRFNIQPSKFINDNKLLFAEGNAIKYICRHAYKGGKEDLKNTPIQRPYFSTSLQVAPGSPAVTRPSVGEVPRFPPKPLDDSKYVDNTNSDHNDDDAHVTTTPISTECYY